MSFFFSKEKAKPVARRAPSHKPQNASKSSKDTLNRLGCKACPLDKAANCTPKMLPDLADVECEIYFLGERPSEADDGKGAPFSDNSGRLLDSILHRSERYSYDNVVRDFDEKKEQPSWVAMECCRGHVTRSIEAAKPKLIVGLGILPLQWMLGSSDMVGLRGRLFAVQIGSHACWFMPTHSVEDVVEKAFDKKQPLRGKFGQCLQFDLLKAKKLAKQLDWPTIDTPQSARAGIQCFNGQSRAQLGQVLALISEARRAPEKAIDLETFPLRPYAANAKLLTCAISFGNTNFSFAVNHPKAGWRPEDLKYIKAALKELLADETTVIAHNTPFEVEWLIHLLGKEAIFHDVWECTMMQAHFIDERRGRKGGNDEQYGPNPYQALDFLVKQYFGISYKSLFRVDRKNMAQADLDETLLYNGADTKYTLRLHHLQKKLLTNSFLFDAYRGSVGRQPTVALMQCLGIAVSQNENRKFRKILGAEKFKAKQVIRAIEDVKRFNVKEHEGFNPASNLHVVKLFKEYAGLGKQLLTSEGKESTDAAILSKLDHPLAGPLDEYRGIAKLLSTNVVPYQLGRGKAIWPDGKIHSSFNTTFAETGRTSSSEPNQQNWPKRHEEWVRSQVVAEKGHILVAFDYGQLEGCTGAMCSKDKSFIKALWEDYDMHMEWAQRAAHLHPALVGGKHMIADKVVMKAFRSLIKNKLVFPAFFGAAAESIQGYIENATGVDVPDHVRDQLFKEFWTTFNGTLKWQKRLVGDYYETGFVESPTGRRRHYPLSKSQAINYPVQSVACDIVCNAMVRLSEYAAQSGKWYFQPIMNIHDDLTFSIPNSSALLEDAISKIYRTMLSPPYDFINVPLSVTCSMGTNWLEMEEIGKFWSHKDL